MSLVAKLGGAAGHLIDDVRSALDGKKVTGVRFTVVANITAPFSLVWLSAESHPLTQKPLASQGRSIPPVDVKAAFPKGSLPKDLFWAIAAGAPIQELVAYLLVGDEVRIVGRRTKDLKAGDVWRGDRSITSTLLGV